MILDEAEMSRLKGRRERLLTHLWKHAGSMDSAVAPFAATQKGIMDGTKVARSHVSELLEKMCREGLVREDMKHVEGSARRTRVYFLTPSGMNIARNIVEELAESRRVHSIDSMPKVRYFFGRDAESRAFGQWLASGSRILAVKGIAGVGKTTFVARMVAETREDWDVFWYRFYEWGSLKNMLSHLSDFLNKMQKPGLRAYLDSAERIDILEVTSILEDAFSKRCALLVFDDYNKAEERVVQFFNSFLEVLERARSVKVVVIGRYIPKFYDHRDVAVRRLVSEMELGGLDRESSRALVRATHRSVSDFDRLYRLTGGHPLAIEFIREVSDLSGEGDLARYIQGEIYSKLSRGEKMLMGLVSVFRYPVALDAMKAANVDAETLDSIILKGLLQSTGKVYDMHDMFRNFFYSRLTDAERREHHTSAAGYYATQEGQLPEIEMLYHLVKAGRRDDAIRLATGQGEAFLSKGHTDEFGAVLSMLQDDFIKAEKRGETFSPKDMAEVSGLMGRVCDHSGRQDEALDYYGIAIEKFGLLKQTTAVREKIAGFCRRTGIIHWGRNHEDISMEWFEKGLKKLGKTKNIETSRLCGWMGWVHFAKGDTEKSLAFHRKELETAKYIGDLREIALAHNDLGTYYHCLCGWKNALSHYRAALEIREKLGDRRGIAALCNNIASIHETMGGFAQAISHYERSLKILAELGDVVNQSLTATSLGQVHHELGDFGRAIDYFERSVDLAGRIGDKVLLAVAYNSMADAYIGKKNYEKAMEFCNDAVKLASIYDHRDILGAAYCTMGQICAAREEWQHAVMYLDNSIEILKKLNLKRQLGKSYQVKAMVLLLENKENIKDAVDNIDAALEIFKQIGSKNDLRKVHKEFHRMGIISKR